MKTMVPTLSSNGHGRQVRPAKNGKSRPAAKNLARENLELHAQIAALKAEDFGIPLQFDNFRD